MTPTQEVTNDITHAFDGKILAHIDAMPSDKFYDADGVLIFDADQLSDYVKDSAYLVLLDALIEYFDSVLAEIKEKHSRLELV
ncbi:MAG: hypothetical protein P8J14_06000 [Emcibacteraceae bacterium]|nr:hypothetical protein [Emcibacteraceae bacterium]